jgi:hypothetical protein
VGSKLLRKFLIYCVFFFFEVFENHLEDFVEIYFQILFKKYEILSQKIFKTRKLLNRWMKNGFSINLQFHIIFKKFFIKKQNLFSNKIQNIQSLNQSKISSQIAKQNRYKILWKN